MVEHCSTSFSTRRGECVGSGPTDARHEEACQRQVSDHSLFGLETARDTGAWQTIHPHVKPHTAAPLQKTPLTLGLHPPTHSLLFVFLRQIKVRHISHLALGLTSLVRTVPPMLSSVRWMRDGVSQRNGSSVTFASCIGGVIQQQPYSQSAKVVGVVLKCSFPILLPIFFLKRARELVDFHRSRCPLTARHHSDRGMEERQGQIAEL